MATPRDDSPTVLETLREINRQLLVCAGSNVSDEVSRLINSGRDLITDAIKRLDKPAETPLSERPSEELRRRASESDAGQAFREML